MSQNTTKPSQPTPLCRKQGAVPEESLWDAINTIDTVSDQAEDIAGRVQEYFLGKFATAEGKLEGDFYTPKCVINLIAEMIEHYNGKIYAPCCSPGGMFV